LLFFQYLHLEPELPPLVYTETAIATEYHTVTQTQHHTHTLPSETVTVPAPANTRIAQAPTPEAHTHHWSTAQPRTTSVQFVREQIVNIPVEVAPEPVVVDVVEDTTTQTIVRSPNRQARPPPKRYWS
jgi:hypothetical protein